MKPFRYDRMEPVVTVSGNSALTADMTMMLHIHSPAEAWAAGNMARVIGQRAAFSQDELALAAAAVQRQNLSTETAEEWAEKLAVSFSSSQD